MKRTLLWLLALILFGACQKFESVGLKQDDPQPNNEYCVSEEDAVARALTAIAQVEGETASRADVTRRLKQIQRVRGSALTRSAEDIAELFYLVNFADDQGYALVAADERMTDVYMMSETGNLDLDKVDPQSGLSYFLERAVTYGHGELIDSLPTLPGFGNGDEMFDPNDSISRIIPEEYNGRWYHVYRRRTTIQGSALLSTRWSQGGPYNGNCPVMANGSRAYAGCVAIAMAQIMAYHRYPSSAFGHSYNWDAMLFSSIVWDSNLDGVASVANLVRDIGTSVNMTYNIDGQGTSKANTSSVANGLRQFGYSADDHCNYNFNFVRQNIDVACPVFVGANSSTGIGHAWVIDAYKYEQCEALYYSVETKEYCFTRNEGNQNLMVSCNWGDGKSGAWLLSGVFDNTNNISPSMVKNIRPNIQL